MSNEKRTGRPVDPNSKASQAHAIYARFNGQDVKSSVICDALIAELNITKGTAQVYLHNARKALGLTTVREKSVAAPVADTQVTADTSTDVAPVASVTETVETVSESDKVAEAA